MTPDEIELLQGAGRGFLEDIGVIVADSVLYGLYLAIFAFGMRALLRRRSRTKYTWILVGLLSILFLFSTANLAIGLSYVILQLRGYLVNNPDQPLLDRFQITNDGTKALAIWLIWLGGSNGSGFLYVFADAVVVWRACVLWPEKRIVTIIPLTLLFVSTASVIVSATVDTVFSTQGTIASASISGILLILSQSLSVTTNIVATTLIGLKAYQHRKMVKVHMAAQSTTVGAILLFMTESGIVFCALQIITLATGAANNTAFTPLDYTSVVWQEILFFAAAAYPILVLLIVDSHESISDHTRVLADSSIARNSNVGSFDVGTHVSFAVRRGISSSGNGIDADTIMGSHVDLGRAYTDRSKTDLEKGEGSSGAVPTGND